MEKSIYLDLINNQKDNNNQNVIYVAVGSAAHRITQKNKLDKDKDKDNDMWILEESANQEYPKFLQDLKLKYKNINLHIFLIDSLLEDIPFVITNGMKGDKLKLKENWFQINNEMFYNKQDNEFIYAIKNNINYKNKNNNNSDFSIFFEKLNTYAKNNNWLVFCCDYTGMLIKDLSSIYEEQISKNLDHIIYGYIADDDKVSTCGIDTTSDDCLFVYYKDNNNKIKVFNPFFYKKNYYD